MGSKRRDESSSKRRDEISSKPEQNKKKPKVNHGPKKSSSKHPLRMPGSRPGEGCFLCFSKDHIAKFCPEKSYQNRKLICFSCRERGHSLKNCPNSQQKNEAKTLCYNCGETGHRLANCPKPKKNGGTRFAECFLCKEVGHISKDCPTNANGIYPKGGSCKICGGVTHLAKDCKEKRTSSGANERAFEFQPFKASKRTVFSGGDDLEDDFVTTDSIAWTSDNEAEKQDDNLSTDMTSLKQKHNKKKSVNKVVNFE